jgi:hypothetical protein
MAAMGCVPAFAAGAATTTTLTMTSGGATVASGGTVVLPAKVTLTATVVAGATPVTKGTVKFCNGTAPVCSDINLIGTAQLTAAGTASLTFVPPITPPNTATPPVTTPHSYTAVFLPTTADLGSTSAVSTLYVSGTFPTTSVLTSVQTATNPPPYIYTLTDTVTATTQAYPTGTVTFYDTSDVLTPASAGPPAVPATYLALGTAPIVSGSSTFVLKAQPLVTSSNLPRYLAVGDLNGDGIPDIAVSDFGINPTTNHSTVDIYFGNGDGTFTAGPILNVSTGNGPQFTVLGDFNNDGCLDIISESYTANSLYLFLNTKTNGVCTGTFGAVKTITNAAIYGPGGIGVGDFNGDGNLDIVVANNSSPSTNPSTGTTSNIFFGDGTGNFTLGGNLTPGGTINPQFFAIGDYNGDGFPDIAVANNATNTINIYLNSGTGTFTLKQTLATTAGNIIILPADVNKDGKIDLVVSTSSTTAPINVWTGNGDGTFTAAANPPATGASYASVAVADFNGDGNVDIITTTNPNNGTDGNVSVLLGNGNGTFQAPTATQSDEGLDTLSLAVGDFNGDGYADVALANFSSNNLAIYTAGYQTTGTATANLPGVTLYGATVNPHLADAVFPTNAIYTTSTSNTVPLIPNILPGTAPSESLTMTATPVTTDYGQQVALQATFTYINLGPSYQPNGGTVTFYQVATNGNLTSLGTATLGTVANPGCSTVTAGTPSVTTTTCISTLLNTTTLPIGADKLEVSYNLVAPPALPAAPATNGANANFTGLISPTVNVTVGQVSGSGDTVTAAPNPTAYGDPDVLTFCIPVGTGTNLGANVPSGSVQFSVGTPAVNLNGPVTIGTTPTTVNGVSCYVATTTTSALPVGSDTVTATFTAGANSGYASAAPTVPVSVAKAPITNPIDPLLSQSFTATTTPATNPTTQAFGKPVTLTYTVPVAMGNTPPTGPVVFTNGTTTLGTCTTFTAGTTVNGITPYSCSLATSALPVGNPDTVTATYTTNDPNYAGGAPALTAPVIVTPSAAGGNLTATPATPFSGAPVTITETLLPVNGVCPTAPVSFYNGGTLANNVDTGGTLITASTGANPSTVSPVPATGTPTSCVASIQTTSLPVGTNNIFATEPAAGSFSAVGSGPAVVTVGQNPGTNDTVTVSPSPTTFGSPTTLTFCIPVVAGAALPTGTVTFTVGGVTVVSTPASPITISQAPTNGCYLATTTTTNLPVGAPTTVTGTYTPGPTSGYGPGAPKGTVTVAPVNPISVVTYGPANPTCSVTLVTLTDTITPVNGVIPTGTVQFYTNTGPIGAPVTITAANNGVATLQIALPCGTTGIYAIFTGNSPYGTSTAPTVPLNLANFTIAATPPAQTVNPGDTTVYTVSLSGAGGVAYTSPVTLTATGLPPGATVTFGTTTYVPGVGPTPTSMTIVTSPTVAMVKPTRGGSDIYYGLLLLPLLGIRRIRKKIRTLPRGIAYGLAALVVLAGLGAMTGCQGGYFGGPPQTYVITVTGTSGTLSHSTTVTLTVE